MKVVKVIVVILLLSLSLYPVKSFGQGELIQDNDVLVVGMDSTFAPYGFLEDGVFKGFDVELAELVFKELGIDYRFQSIDWSMKEQELSSGNIDLIWNGYSKTPEREALVTFSDVYIDGRTGVLVKADSDIHTFAGLDGKKVATQEGSSQLDALLTLPELVKTFDDGRVLTYASFNDVLLELENDRVDAVVVAELITRYYFSQNGQGESYRMLDEDFGLTETAVGFRKTDEAFVFKFNQALAKIKETKTYKNLENKWFAQLDKASEEDRNYFLPLINASKMTLVMFTLVLIFSVPLGLILALIDQRSPKWVKLVLKGYVYVFRGTPLLLQLMVVYFGLPYMGIVIDRFPAALLTMVINYAAYLLEIFRGGLQAIPKGQYESLNVLSINTVTGYRSVILPQVWKIVLPSISNEIVSLVKDTSLIYILGLDELLKMGRTMANQYASMVPYLYVGLLYLVFTAVVTFTLNAIEK